MPVGALSRRPRTRAPRVAARRDSPRRGRASVRARRARRRRTSAAPSASVECAFLVLDGIQAGHRVDLRPEPAEPDEHPRAIRAGRKRLGEMLQQREHVLLPLSRCLVQIGGPEKAPRPRSCIALGRQRRGSLRQHSRHLRRAACVEPIGCALELGRDRLARLSVPRARWSARSSGSSSTSASEHGRGGAPRACACRAASMRAEGG